MSSDSRRLGDELEYEAGRRLSTEPALEEYIPEAPIDDEARKRNGNLPGMGGIYNMVNSHLYHYAGNNPLKYTDPDGRDIIRLSKDDIKVSKWYALNRHLNTYIELKSGVQMQIRKNEIKIDLLKGEITKMKIDLMYQSFEDTLDIINTFGNSAIGAAKGYSQGHILGALAGAIDNLDAQSVSEFYMDMTSEKRLQSIDFETLKGKNKIEINRLISENKGLTALQQTYQNEINAIAREMERRLNE